MKTSDMLAAAKLELWVPKDEDETLKSFAKSTAICSSLKQAVPIVASRRLRLEVSKRLGRHRTVTAWLHARGFISHKYLFDCTLAEIIQVQQFRLRWLEHLEAEYKAKGD